MTPPWNAHPEIEAGSIGWRMGYGKDYLHEFNQWFARTPGDANKRYAEENPEPVE